MLLTIFEKTFHHRLSIQFLNKSVYNIVKKIHFFNHIKHFVSLFFLGGWVRVVCGRHNLMIPNIKTYFDKKR